PGMTANCTFVLEKVDDAIKIPNAALRFKPSREQIMALMEKFGMRGGHHRGSGSGAGSGGWMGRSEGGPMGGMFGGMGGGGGGVPSNVKGANDRKMVWKLVDGKPKMVFVKLGLTDGSATQLLEGDLQPGDQLITEIQGLQTSTRKF